MSTMRIALLVGALAAMLGAGVAYAAIPDGGGVFSACYKTNGGQLRLVDSAGTARSPRASGAFWTAG